MNKEKVSPDFLIRKIEMVESLKKEASQSSFNKIILLTPKEVCELLHISSRTLQSWRDVKTLSYIQIGRIILYRVEDIISCLDQHYVKTLSRRTSHE